MTFAATKRTGAEKLLLLAHAVCRLVSVFRAPLADWIDRNLTPDQRVVVNNWLLAADGVCLILETISRANKGDMPE